MPFVEEHASKCGVGPLYAKKNNKYSLWGMLNLVGTCHKRQRRKRQSVTAKREKSQTLKVLTAILTLPNLT